MAELRDVLGAVLASVAQARRIADEETALIAEQYRDNPLLEGMSVPRLRLPNVTVDIPVIIEGHDAGVEEESDSATNLVPKLKAEFTAIARNQGLTLPRGFIGVLETELRRALTVEPSRRAGNREAYGRAVEKAILRTLRNPTFARRFSPAFTKEAAQRMRAFAESIAITRPAVSPDLKIGVVTAEVKDRTDPDSVTRLKITLREEGMEWSIGESEDGTIFKRLVPE